MLCETKEESESERQVDFECCFGYVCMTRIMPAQYYIEKRFPRSAALLCIMSTVNLVFLCLEWNDIYIGMESLIILTNLIMYVCIFQLYRIVKTVNPAPNTELVHITKYLAWFGAALCLTYIIYVSVLAATRTLPNMSSLYQCSLTSEITLIVLAVVLRKYDEQLEREIVEKDFVSINQQLRQDNTNTNTNAYTNTIDNTTISDGNGTSLRNPLLSAQQMHHTNAFTVAPISYQDEMTKDDHYIQQQTKDCDCEEVQTRGDKYAGGVGHPINTSTTMDDVIAVPVDNMIKRELNEGLSLQTVHTDSPHK